ncbi:MAG: hypothetical protein LBR18_08795 [Tannerella sp.]|jgi:hypothetical protein|nr:hypothetical protein [Tannerella sp.]
MATQRVINWINRKFSAYRSKNDFEEMESFCLLWNVFEKEAGNGQTTSLGLRRIETFISNVNISNHQIIKDGFDFFKRRYININTGSTNRNFDTLFSRTPKKTEKNYKDRLEVFLTNNNASKKDMILGLSIIAYRIRNNSFHGTKGLDEIVTQQDTFKHLNDFLMEVLTGFNLI